MRDTNSAKCLGGTIRLTSMSGEGTSDVQVGQEPAAPIPIPMPTGCHCVATQDGDDPNVFTWRYVTECPVGPRDHKAVWRPAFKGIIDRHLGLCRLHGGAMIIIDGGDVSAILLFHLV
jgi:hypothetical protein